MSKRLCCARCGAQATLLYLVDDPDPMPVCSRGYEGCVANPMPGCEDVGPNTLTRVAPGASETPEEK